MVKPFTGILGPRNTLFGGFGLNSESRERRQRGRLLLERRSPQRKVEQLTDYGRQTSPKRPRRETRSTSAFEDSPMLLDAGSEDETDFLDHNPISHRIKRRRTELNDTGDGDSHRATRQHSPRLDEVDRVENMMDSSGYADWSRAEKMKDQMRDAASNRASGPMRQYPERLITTKKLNLPSSKTPQLQTLATKALARSDQGTRIEFGFGHFYENGTPKNFDKVIYQINSGTGLLYFQGPDSEDEQTVDIQKVYRVTASRPFAGTKVRLHFTARDPITFDLEVKNRTEFDRLIAIFESFNHINTQRKDEAWLESARERARRAEGRERTYHQELDVDMAESNQRNRDNARRSALGATSESHPKLSARLQGDQVGNREMRRDLLPATPPTPGEPRSSLRRRVTRSSSGVAAARNATEERMPGDVRSEKAESSEDAATLMAARPRDFGPRWKKPLVFPPDGKKRATVDYEDLLRLDDGEFFNDNIIGFYLRYLMHRLEDQHCSQSERIYWFNSYFFEKLTSHPKPRGSINYDAVKRWTRDVDLFRYDYVVVPVNENAHWYLVLICNLPQLFRIEIKDDDDEKTKAPGSSPHHPIGIDESQETRTVPLTNPQEDIPSRDDLDEWVIGPPTTDSNRGVSSDPVTETPASPDESNQMQADTASPEQALNAANPENSLNERMVLGDITGVTYETTSAHARASQRKKKRPSLRQYDPSTPAVITLDSLGNPHPETTKAIKQYLVAEAEDKKGDVPFDESSLQGMNAKGIPQQDNWCDCGPYLLGYMDKFTSDPQAFVSKLLRREFDEKRDWPNDLHPSRMRSNIRDLILRLHQLQKGGAKRSKKIALPLASDPIDAEDLIDDSTNVRQRSITPKQEQQDAERDIVKSSIEETLSVPIQNSRHGIPQRPLTSLFRAHSSIDATVIPDSQEGMLGGQKNREISAQDTQSRNASPIPDNPAASSPPSLVEQLRRAAGPDELENRNYVLLDDGA